MTLVYFLMRKSRRGLVAFVILVGILAGLSNTALLALINNALHGAADSRLTTAATFAAVCALMLASRVVSQSLLVRLAQGILFDLRMQLSRQVLDVPLRHLEKAGRHRVISALTEQTNVITNALITLPNVCMQLATLVGGLVYLGWLSWPLLLGLMGFMALGVLGYQLPAMRGIKYLKLANEEIVQMYRHFRTLTDGTKELKLHRRRREDFLSKVLRPTADAAHRHQVVASTIMSTATGWGQLSVFIVVGLILFAAPGRWGDDAHILTGYALTILYLMNPLQYVLDTLPTYGRAKIAIKQVEELGLSLAAESISEDAPATDANARRWKSLELVGAAHSYSGEKADHRFTLGPLDLTFRPGELVFVTGGNGSGKTTLAKLLLGLYAPEQGEVRLDGRTIDDRNREHYRQHFTAIFSDFFVFDSLLGLDRYELDAQALEYLAELQLDHKVQVEDGVLSTTELSQGQRKRLALLTAYLEDRPIYLFDEWAADQDPVFKETFYYKLLPGLKDRGKTVVVISHDDHYYHVADRVIKLDYGQIVYDSERAAGNECAGTPFEIPADDAALLPVG
ncbi:MAG TPA: cyclic peptide export ABC transporter [Pyrinomonadaceae bacterium]